MTGSSIPTLIYSQVSSTMDVAAQVYAAGPGDVFHDAAGGRWSECLDQMRRPTGPFAVAARVQAHGRGRRGRRWLQGSNACSASTVSADESGVEGAGFTFSLSSAERVFSRLADAFAAAGDALPVSVVFPRKDVRVPLEWLSLAVGCAVYDAAEDLSVFCQAAWPELEWVPLDADRRLFLKWPNDLVAFRPGTDRLGKVAGVLVEAAGSATGFERVIVGLGLNLLDAPGELVPHALSLVDVLQGHWPDGPEQARRGSDHMRRRFLKWKGDSENRAVVASRYFESFERELLEYLTVPRTIGQLRSLALARMLPLGSALRVTDGQDLTSQPSGQDTAETGRGPLSASGTSGASALGAGTAGRTGRFVGLGDDACLLLELQKLGAVEKVYAGDVSLEPVVNPAATAPERQTLSVERETRRPVSWNSGAEEPADRPAHIISPRVPITRQAALHSGLRADVSVSRPASLLLDLGNTRCHWLSVSDEAEAIGQSSDEWGHLSYDSIGADVTKPVDAERAVARSENRAKLAFDESLRAMLSLLAPQRRGILNITYITVQDPLWANTWLQRLKACILSAFPEMKLNSRRIDLDLLRSIEPDLNRLLEDYGRGLGVDRALKFLFANRQAAELGAPVCVLSLGTATTVEIADGQGRLLESLICPGLQMAFDALHEKTARLPHIELQNLFQVVEGEWDGNGTISSLARGSVLPVVHVLAGLSSRHSVRRIWVCGGSAARFMQVAANELSRVALPELELVEDLGLLALREWLASRPDGRLQNRPEQDRPEPRSGELCRPQERTGQPSAHPTDSDHTFLADMEHLEEGDVDRSQAQAGFEGLGEASQRIAESLYAGRKNLRSAVRRTPVREDFRRLGGRVETHGVGERVDRYLSMRFRFHTRLEWRDRLQQGEVLVERNAPRQREPGVVPRLEAVKHTYRLKPFDQMWMHQPAEYEPGFVKETKVLVDTGDEIVFHKPGNLVVHATGLYGRNTFLDVLDEQGYKGVYPVHRIDRETSGILMCARTSATRHLLARLFRDGRMHKMYLAFVKSRPDENVLPDRFTVDAAIGSAAGSAIRLKMWVGADELAQDARTHFVTLSRNGPYGFLACFPETGRTNQIRVHLAAAGHWILGDKMYHPDEQVFLEFFDHGLTADVLRQTELPRQALHHAALYADEEVSGLKVFSSGPVVCGLPDDLLESGQISELARRAGMPLSGPAQSAFILSLLEDFRKSGSGSAGCVLKLSDLQRQPWFSPS